MGRTGTQHTRTHAWWWCWTCRARAPRCRGRAGAWGGAGRGQGHELAQGRRSSARACMPACGACPRTPLPLSPPARRTATAQLGVPRTHPATTQPARTQQQRNASNTIRRRQRAGVCRPPRLPSLHHVVVTESCALWHSSLRWSSSAAASPLHAASTQGKPSVLTGRQRKVMVGVACPTLAWLHLP